MAWVKLYERIGWENVPSTKSPINDLNLNKIDIAVDGLDDRVIELQTTKAEQTDLLTSVKNVDINETTGVITITFNNNTTKTFDTVLEKVVTNFRYDAATQSLVLTLADGTTQSIPLSEFITQNEFLNSDRITFSVSEGKVRADLIKGSITGDYLQPNYLADITAQASLAGASAAAAATSEANAAQSAQTASTKATEASQSATTASTKADEASASATTAGNKASEATTAAQTATTKASEASTSAQTATTKATEAATSASNAATSETNAQNSATTATTKAAEASASADRAEQAAQATERVVRWSQRKGYVGKNLIPDDYIKYTVGGGLTYDANEDGSITINGTSTVARGYVFLNTARLGDNAVLKAGTYIFSAGVDVPVNAFLTIEVPRGSQRNITNGNKSITFTLDEDSEIFECRTYTAAGLTYDNFTVYPMLRRADISDDSYEKYIPPNTDIKSKVSWESENLLGAKNLLWNVPYEIRTDSGVVCTVDDGVYTLNGKPSTDKVIAYIIGSAQGFRLEKGEYALSTSPKTKGVAQNYVVTFRNVDKNIRYEANATFDARFVIDDENYSDCFEVYIWVVSTVTYDNQILKPMLTPVSAYKANPEYAPYAMSNRELTEKVQGIDERLGTVSNVVTDLNDETQITKHFKANSVVFLPITGATQNQPEGISVWGYLAVYFGGNTDNYMTTLYSAVNLAGTDNFGNVYMRVKAGGALKSWRKVTLTTVT